MLSAARCLLVSHLLLGTFLTGCSGSGDEVVPLEKDEADEADEADEMVEEPEPYCGDNVVHDGEVCDDNRYCAEDCSGFVGSCGDGVLQSFEACDTGNQTDPGCVECEVTFSYVCTGEPSVCGHSGLPDDLRAADFTPEQHLQYCEWLLTAVGGAGEMILDCRFAGQEYIVDTLEECTSQPLSGYGACTVGDFTAWLEGHVHFCAFAVANPPACNYEDP